jgi:hypothetical protein
MSPPTDLSGLPRAELEARVAALRGEVAELKQLVAALRDENARLRNLTVRPVIRPSGTEDANGPKPHGKRRHRRGRGKMTPRVAVKTQVFQVTPPQGPRFKGYERYQVQDLVLTARAVRYRRERWLTPTGETIVAPLPAGIRGHFGPELHRFVLMQYHQGQVTVERLVSPLLSGPVIWQLAPHEQRRFPDQGPWRRHLEQLGITAVQVPSDPARVATGGALWGAVAEHRFLNEAVILSDDAGQFNMGQHALYWVHAERLVHKLETFTDQQRAAQESVHGLIW